MGFIKQIKLPNNEVQYMKNTIIPVVGTQTSSTSSWTGNIDLPSLYDGLTIAYFLPQAGAADTNVTLELTLSNGSTTGAIDCYYSGNELRQLTKDYVAGSTIIMTYWNSSSIGTSNSRWIVNTSDTRVLQSNSTSGNYRAIMLGCEEISNDTPYSTSNVRNKVFKTEKFQYNPSGGILKNSGHIYIKSDNLDRDGEAPTSDQTGKSLYFVDKDSNGIGRISTVQRKTNNKKDLFITVYNASGTSNSIGIRILDDGTPSYYLSYPSAFRAALDNAAYIDANTITNNQVIIADGTDGKLKSSGNTIATSITDTDDTLPTSKAVKTFVEGKGYVTTDTKNTASSTNTSSKIFLIGATSQTTGTDSIRTYSHDTVYVGTDGHLYSNSNQVVNLSDSQALTNKTYNGYTLAAACAKGVTDNSSATAITSSDTNLITGRTLYYAGYSKTDEKVKQSTNSEDKNFPLLFSKAETSNTTANITNSVYRNNSIYINPSTKQIFVDNNTGSQWKKGRETASLIKTITPTSYSPITDIKSTSGDWSIGTVNNTENLYFVYTTDDNYSGSGNKALKYYLEGADSTNSYAILHSGNYNSYSPTLTGTGASGDWGINAATATKATQDSDGNTIKTTYLKLSGGTLTGSIYVNGTTEKRISLKNHIDNQLEVYMASATNGRHGFYSTGYLNGTTYTQSGKWLVMRDSDGKVYFNGCTIESSVPSDAVFTDEKLRLNALSAPATGDEKAYYVAFKGAGLNTGYYNNGFLYRTLDGAAASGSTAAVDGYSTLQLGNATASGTDGNRFGRLRIYSKGTKYGALIQGDTTGNVTHTLPATSGTILNSGNYDDYVSPLLQATVGHSCKNLLKITATSTTKNGVTFNVNSTTGIITATGKSSANFYYTIGSIVNTGSTAIKLYMSGCANDGSTDTYYVYAYDISASPSAKPKQWDNSTQSESCTFLTDDEEILIPAGHTVQIRIYIKTNYPGQNTTITFKPMVRDGNILNNTFEPYVTPTDEKKQDKLYEDIFSPSPSQIIISGISNISYFIVNITDNGVTDDGNGNLIFGGPEHIYSVFVSISLLDLNTPKYFSYLDNKYMSVSYANNDSLYISTDDNNYKIKSIVYFYK